MGLTDWKDTLVNVLPYGIQRFLGIAQAIMSPIEILLLDEPLTGLNEEDILRFLRSTEETTRSRDQHIHYRTSYESGHDAL